MTSWGTLYAALKMGFALGLKFTCFQLKHCLWFFKVRRRDSVESHMWGLNLRTAREAGNCGSPALRSHFLKWPPRKPATTLTLSPTSVGGLVALISKNGVLEDLKPLDWVFGAVTPDELTLQGSLATNIIHRCFLYDNTWAHSHQHFLNRQLTGRKIISNNVAYNHSSWWDKVNHMENSMFIHHLHLHQQEEGQNNQVQGQQNAICRISNFRWKKVTACREGAQVI